MSKKEVQQKQSGTVDAAPAWERYETVTEQIKKLAPQVRESPALPKISKKEP